MRILCVVPTSRYYYRSIESILRLKWAGGLDLIFLTEGDEQGAHPYDNMTRKYEYARKLALAAEYGALLTIEDDVIVPPDAVERLERWKSPVTYGLIVSRHLPHFWGVATELSGDAHYHPLDAHPLLRERLWGRTAPVVGCGFYCTLIRREVLKEIPIHRDGPNGPDWDFSLDCQAKGISQLADLSVICGHILSDTQVLWPDPKEGRRWEAY